VESFRKDSTPARPKKGESSQIHLVG